MSGKSKTNCSQIMRVTSVESICSGSITRRATGAIGSNSESVVPSEKIWENVSIGCSDKTAPSIAPVA